MTCDALVDGLAKLPVRGVDELGLGPHTRLPLLAFDARACAVADVAGGDGDQVGRNWHWLRVGSEYQLILLSYGESCVACLLVCVGHYVLADLLPVVCGPVRRRRDADGGEEDGDDGGYVRGVRLDLSIRPYAMA